MPVIHGFVTPHPPVIVPAVGNGREREIEKTAESLRRMAKQIAELKPDTLVIISPHSTMYSDYIHISPGGEAKGSLKRFGAPEVYRARYDADFVWALESLCAAGNLPAGTQGEREPELDHGVLTPLSFINREYTGYMLVRAAPSQLSPEEHYRFGMLIEATANNLGRRTVVIASGDLSHKLSAESPYGFASEGPELDKRLTEIFASGDFGALFDIDEALRDKAAECGYLPSLVLAGALDKKEVAAELFSYEGPFGVGYAVASFSVAGKNPARDFLSRQKERTTRHIAGIRAGEDPYVRLARETLEAFVLGEIPKDTPPQWPKELRSERAGVFVSIKKRGRLRGCIGTTEPTTPNVAEEIRRNAVSSGTRDPRFSPVTPEELPELVYSVDILSPAEPCDETMLAPDIYGVIVTSGARRGLLLPNLEGVNSVAAQLDIAKSKAGIGRGEPCGIERFKVVRHK